MNVFAEMVHAVTDPGYYVMFLKNRRRKTFLFGFLLSALYFLVTIMVPYGQFQLKTGGVVRIVDEILPDFELSGGRMSVGKVFELDQDDTYVYVNTEDYELDDAEIGAYMKEYKTVLLMDAERAVIQNDGKLQTIEFAELGDLSLKKASLLQILRPYVTIVTVVILVVIFLLMQAGFFFGVLFVALLGMIAASVMKEKVSFGALYQMGVYARTAPLLLKAVISLLPFGLPFFWIVSMGISLFYLSAGIRGVRAEREEAERLAQTWTPEM